MSERAAIVNAEPPAETAARWFAIRRRHASAREEQEFRRWLEADPANRLAYEDVTRSWEIAAMAASDPQVATMRSEALMLRPEKPREYSKLWGALATAAMLVLVVGGVHLADPAVFSRAAQADRDHIVLKTGIGQRATATLEDGSLVTLNTSSVLEINYTQKRRDVRLVAGQVLFKVAHDTARPFVVAAAGRQVVALGTQFEVRLDGQKVRVALLEGKVRVEPLSPSNRGGGGKTLEIPGATAVLEPGQQLLATAAGDVLVKPADVEELVSWQSGRVRFENASLAEAVAEMNRYSRTPIVIEDPDIARIRISGAFRTGQSQSFAEAISEAFPIETDVKSDTIRLHQPS